jgi:hypothetical protein
MRSSSGHSPPPARRGVVRGRSLAAGLVLAVAGGYAVGEPTVAGALEFGFTIANGTGNPVSFTSATKTPGREWVRRGNLARDLGYRAFATFSSTIDPLRDAITAGRGFVKVRIAVPPAGRIDRPGYRPPALVTVRADANPRKPADPVRWSCTFDEPHPVYVCAEERRRTVRRDLGVIRMAIYHYVIKPG